MGQSDNRVEGFGSADGAVGLRPIHYIGNKSRHLDAIEQVIDTVARREAMACDLFAGTAVVTRRLAQGRPVISADIQFYSQVLARALTRPTEFSESDVAALVSSAREWLDGVRPWFKELLDLESRALSMASIDAAPFAALIEQGSLAAGSGSSAELERAKRHARRGISPDSSTLAWYYGGVYFSYAQALELDALRHAVRLGTADARDDTAVAAIMGAASDAVSTIGNHFAQPVQPRRKDGMIKQNWVGTVARRRRYSVIDGFTRWLGRYRELRSTAYPCTAVRSGFQDTLSNLGSDIGVIYADPPYTRDHYSRFYHVIETIALDDDPGVTTSPSSSRPSRGLYRIDRHQSPFGIRSQAQTAFRELFLGAKRLGVPLVLSYSPMSAGTKARPQTRLVSVDDLTALARNYFNDVDLVEVTASLHSRFNRAELSANIGGNAEVLLVAQN